MVDDVLPLGLERLLSRPPIGRADLAVLVCEGERLQQADGLVDRPSNGQVIDGDLPDLAVTVDDEEATEGDSVVLLEHAVGPGDGQVLVSDQGDVDRSQPAGGLLGLDVGQMGIDRVAGDANHLEVIILISGFNFSQFLNSQEHRNLEPILGISSQKLPVFLFLNSQEFGKVDQK